MSAVGTGIINIGLVIFLAPLFEGTLRKLKARIHSRQGPPITQPYLDILKLLGKEDLRVASGTLFYFAPIVSLLAILVVALLSPLGLGSEAIGGDIIVWVYFLSLAAVATMLCAFASENPFAFLGAGREMMMLLTAEPVAVIALMAVGVKAQSLLMGDMAAWHLQNGISISTIAAGIAFLLALQANVGKLPFDLPEAETELMAGPFIELSGPRLAMFKMAMYGKQLIFASIFVYIFLPWGRVGSLPVNLIIHLAKVFGLLILVGVIDSVNPRLRIDQSMNFFSKIVVISLAALVFAAAGL